MTLNQFREYVIALREKALEPEDRRALDAATKSVATYSWVGPVDQDTMNRLIEKYEDA